VDGLGAEGRGRHCQQRQEGQSDEGTHGGWQVAGLAARSGEGGRSDKAIWPSTCDAGNERDEVVETEGEEEQDGDAADEAE
jgi:hypothetical protein